MIFAILIQHQIKIKIDLFESLMIKIKSDVSPILGFGFGYKIFWVLGIGFGYIYPTQSQKILGVNVWIKLHFRQIE